MIWFFSSVYHGVMFQIGFISKYFSTDITRVRNPTMNFDSNVFALKEFVPFGVGMGKVGKFQNSPSFPVLVPRSVLRVAQP